MHYPNRLSLMVTCGLFLGLVIIYFNWNTDVLNTHIEKTYDNTIKDSTFAVSANTAFYPGATPHPSSTWISNPVIVNFDDPDHGFTLPKTKFGAIGFDEGKVSTITISPMLETLPFDQLIVLLDQLQNQLKNAGWKPRSTDRNSWIRTDTTADHKALQSELFDQVTVTMLLIPHKYSLALNVKCYARCNERNPKTAKYLIDVSIGRDYYSQ